MSIKRPCRYSVSISENQQGFLYAIDVSAPMIKCKVTKTKSVFPSDSSLEKMLYLASGNVIKMMLYTFS